MFLLQLEIYNQCILKIKSINQQDFFANSVIDIRNEIPYQVNQQLYSKHILD